MSPLSVDMLVEAATEEEAIEKAHMEWPGLSNYCGNGKRGGALCGPYQDDHDANIEADGGDEPEFKSAELEET